MVRLFDICALITGIVVVTGGFILKIPHVLHADLATIDVCASVTFVCLLMIWKRAESSRTLSFVSNEFEKGDSVRHAKIAFFVTFGALFLAHVGRHWSLLTDGFDVAFIHQALFNPLRGPFMPADISPSGSALGEHLLFSVVPLSLVTSWLRIDELLFLIQNLALSVPLYFLIFKSPAAVKLKRWAWVVLLVILANRSFRNSLTFDFREDSFAFMGLCFAILSLWRGRALLFLAALVFALLSKEHVFLIAVFFVPVILLSKKIPMPVEKLRVLALLTFVITIAYGITAFKFLIPYFNPVLQKASPITAQLHQYGSTPLEILTHILFVPANWLPVLSHIFTQDAILYLVKMLLPFLPFCLSREALIFAIPGFAGLALNVFTGYHNQIAMLFHYDLVVVPFLFAAIILGVEKQAETGFLRAGEPRRNLYAFTCILFAMMVADRSPVFQFTHFLPNLSEIEARIALLKLDRHTPILSNRRIAAQVNQHVHMTIVDSNCQSFNLSPRTAFSGYVVVDHQDASTQNCEPHPGAPIFENAMISIYQN